MMSEATTRRPTPNRGRLLILGLAVPAVIVAAAMVVLHSWLPDLPAKIAVHWSPSGPDGFAAATGLWWWVPLVALIGPLVLVAIGWRLGRDAMTRRICLALAWFLTVFLIGLLLSVVASQRGLTDAHEVGDIDPLISVCLALAAAAAVGGWFAMPADPRPEQAAHLDPSTTHLDLAPGERIVWTNVARSKHLVPITVSVLLGLSVILALTGGLVALPIVLLVGAIVLVLEALFSSARVTIDNSGMRITFGPGIKARSIAARDIESVEVVDVNPMRQFAGYGIRTGVHGTVGVIMRKGEGIKVTMGDGRTFVVTIDNATEGAKALAAVVLQAQRTHG